VLLPDDPRRIVSHGYPLFADSLLTTPTQLESTSLVLAYGLDIFMTRVAPSGSFDVLSEEFNKIQLVLTVLGLAVAILITRPLVSAKIRKAKWYY
jgi:ER membrane protein complex subunit 1